MDVFPPVVSSVIKILDHPRQSSLLVNEAKKGRIQAFISFLDSHSNRVFHKPVPTEKWINDTKLLANFSRVIEQSHTVHTFDAKLILWDKVHKRLQLQPNRHMKNADTRFNFKLENTFFVKAYFTFGQWIVDRHHEHLYQVSDAPLILYVMKPSPDFVRRQFNPQHQWDSDRYILTPNQWYFVPEGTVYTIVTAQKTCFSVDIVHKDDMAVLKEQREIFPCTEHKKFIVYNLPPPTPAHEPSFAVPRGFRKRKAYKPVFDEPPSPEFHEPVFHDQQEPPPVFYEEHSPEFYAPVFHDQQVFREPDQQMFPQRDDQQAFSQQDQETVEPQVDPLDVEEVIPADSMPNFDELFRSISYNQQQTSNLPNNPQQTSNLPNNPQQTSNLEKTINYDEPMDLTVTRTCIDKKCNYAFIPCKSMNLSCR